MSAVAPLLGISGHQIRRMRAPLILWVYGPASIRLRLRANRIHVADHIPLKLKRIMVWGSWLGWHFFGEPLRTSPENALERFCAKWIPVRVKKTRQNKELEPRF